MAKRLASFIILGIWLALVPFQSSTGAQSGQCDLLDRCVTNERAIATVLEIYYSDHAMYPKNLEALVPKYIREIPLEPASGLPYSYVLDSKFHYTITCTGDHQITVLGYPQYDTQLGIQYRP